MSRERFIQLLRNTTFHPLTTVTVDDDHFLQLDFTKENTELDTLDLVTTEKFNDYVFGKIADANKIGGIGGYLENRVIYRRSPHFSSEENRSIHLGVDIWLPAGTPFFAPWPARVHSMANNNHFGDYGPTIILEHSLEGHTFYTLYGHLSLKSLAMVSTNQRLDKGELFCEMGDFPENGDWPPHLHFQLITDLLGKEGDFPGVCKPSELAFYQEICLDPMLIIGQL